MCIFSRGRLSYCSRTVHTARARWLYIRMPKLLAAYTCRRIVKLSCLRKSCRWRSQRTTLETDGSRGSCRQPTFSRCPSTSSSFRAVDSNIRRCRGFRSSSFGAQSSPLHVASGAACWELRKTSTTRRDNRTSTWLGAATWSTLRRQRSLNSSWMYVEASYQPLAAQRMCPCGYRRQKVVPLERHRAGLHVVNTETETVSPEANISAGSCLSTMTTSPLLCLWDFTHLSSPAALIFPPLHLYHSPYIVAGPKLKH
mmetsp:Transcript_29653/g.49146  ORF Transcript_29653/g.49146 Transcript_29653/m.49146 type:complete len:255 (+) Transcript_29653:169-933(+)